MTVAVCDDSRYAPLIVAELKELAAEAEIELSVDAFKGYSYLLAAMKTRKYDLLVLETSIRGASGIDFARNLRLSKCDADIIFVSSTDEYALAAYSVFPIGYILKPFQRRRMRPPFKKAAEKYSQKPTIILRDVNGSKVTVSIEDLLYIEVIGNELYVHSRAEIAKCIGSLSETHQSLPQKQFYRSHRSFIVNLGRVRHVEKYQFTMDNGDLVTVAKNRYAEAKKVWRDYLQRS